MGVEPPVTIPKDGQARARHRLGDIHEKAVFVVEAEARTRKLLDHLRLIRPKVGEAERCEALRLAAAVRSQVHVQISTRPVRVIEAERADLDSAVAWTLANGHSEEAAGSGYGLQIGIGRRPPPGAGVALLCRLLQQQVALALNVPELGT